jgi:tripartite-type tricarboxylate transporter receptor subunit TctC
MKEKKYGRMLIAITIFVTCARGLSAIAAVYPTKPVSLIIPYPAGGSTEVTTRA